MTRPARKDLILALLGMVWAGAVGLGMQRVLVYENTPGPVARVPTP